MLDFHSHLMPGVDDGAADLDESRAGLAAMVDQGVGTIITTPHIRGSLTLRTNELDRYLGELDAAYELLATLAVTEFPGTRIERGVEMMLDIPSPCLDDPRLRLAGSSYALFEFPYMMVPPNSTVPIRTLRNAGVVPVIAHPERYSNISGNIELVESWIDAGACIQVNCGSIIGQYGSGPKRHAWTILGNGWAHYLSSDYHSRGRCPIRACAAAMQERGAESQFQMLTETNPERMIRSEAPLPVEPVEEIQLGFWKKVFG